jgi:hypothetical protein
VSGEQTWDEKLSEMDERRKAARERRTLKAVALIAEAKQVAARTSVSVEVAMSALIWSWNR